ncbi:porin, partial [Agrobacterium rosae]
LGNVGPRGLDGAIYGAGISPNADFSSNDAWTAGLTVDYKITDGLATKITANYYDEDNNNDQVTGFVRLQRSF